jgi:hypothetical protein
MAKAKTAKVSSRRSKRASAPAAITRAAASLKPPTESMLVGREMMRARRQVEALGKRRPIGRAQLVSVAKRLTSVNPPTMQTMGGGWASVFRVDLRSAVSLVLDRYYVPTSTTGPGIVPDHRYVHEQTWESSIGVARASKATGELVSIAYVDINSGDQSTWAGVYAAVKTDPKLFGQLSRVSFEPDISWQASGRINVEWDWVRNVAGGVTVEGVLWLSVYELNPATGKLEALANQSAVRYSLFLSSMTGAGGGPVLPNGGSLMSGQARLQFIANPARTYWVGVQTQVRVSHNYIGDSPIAQPPARGQLTAERILNPQLRQMWDHRYVLNP